MLIGLVHLKDRGFELQLVPPDILSKALKREHYDMTIRINDTIPNLVVNTAQGTFSLHDWIGENWAILFSHPKDFTPVCTTEFGEVANLADEWEKRHTKVIGVSVDSAEDHKLWKQDIERVGGRKPGFLSLIHI